MLKTSMKPFPAPACRRVVGVLLGVGDVEFALQKLDVERGIAVGDLAIHEIAWHGRLA